MHDERGVADGGVGGDADGGEAVGAGAAGEGGGVEGHADTKTRLAEWGQGLCSYGYRGSLTYLNGTTGYRRKVSLRTCWR